LAAAVDHAAGVIALPARRARCSVITASGFLSALPAVRVVLGFREYMAQGLTAGSVKE
jgi:ABC-type glycerol-3-phosphate transport system permease component